MAVSRTHSEYVSIFDRGCVLSPLVFIICMERISRRSTTPDCVTRVESLLFADDVARLASSSGGLQRARDRFAAECAMVGMQITSKKTEVLLLSRQKEHCAVNINGTSLNEVEKLKYVGVELTNDTRVECDIDQRIGWASAILRSLYRWVVTKNEVSRRTKMSMLNAVCRPRLIYGHEQWTMTRKNSMTNTICWDAIVEKSCRCDTSGEDPQLNDTRFTESRVITCTSICKDERSVGWDTS